MLVRTVIKYCHVRCESGIEDLPTLQFQFDFQFKNRNRISPKAPVFVISNTTYVERHSCRVIHRTITSGVIVIYTYFCDSGQTLRCRLLSNRARDPSAINHYTKLSLKLHLKYIRKQFTYFCFPFDLFYFGIELL